MCFEGNSAPLSATYLASQLVALHKNAVECAADHPGDINFASAEYAKSKYTRALAQYHHLDPKIPAEHLGVGDLPFAATFDAPDLKFVCNHEAVLFLNLNGGHLRLTHPSTQANGHGPQIGNRTFQKVHAAFRVQFVRTDVKGVDSKIGNDDATHYIHMMVLRFETAKLVDLNFDQSLGEEYRESLASYLHSYLAFLHAAGNHVLFDIPDFAAQGGQASWKDYALLRNHIDPDVYCKDISLFGIPTPAINSYLETQWSAAVSKARTAGDYLMASISEISSNWLLNAAVDNHFFIRFGAPKVKPLCPHEVVLYFDVEDIAFFDNSDFERAKPSAVYNNWTIAFVVNVVEVDSNASVLKLDFTTARFSSFFSSYSKVDSFVVAYFNAIVKFITIDYLDILLLYGYNIIYQATFSVLGRDTSDTGYWKRVARVDQFHSLRRHGQVLIWLERIRELSLSGADQVLALSEDSINRILFSRWQSAGASNILSTWARDTLKLSFDPFTVRLLSNGKAILYVDIVHGENNLKVVQHQQPAATRSNAFWLSSFWGYEIANDVVTTTKPYNFERVTVAFEVDLALVPFDKLDIEESVSRDLYNSIITIKEKRQYVVRNLVLNLRTAKYLPNLSSVGNLGTGKEGLARLEALRTALGDYLHEVSRTGHGIIQTIPTLLANDADPFALTDVDFKVLTKESVTLEQYIDADEARSIVDTPVLVIFGVSTRRPVPPFLSKWSVGWLPSGVAKNTVGTVWFSKETFLERRLLALLEGFNARTTILPSFAGVLNGVWKYDLTTWASSKYHSGRGERCPWTEVVGSNPRYLEYVWEHRDEWNHETEGATFSEGEYSLSCHTENKLLIPTEYRPHRDLEITVAGKSVVEISSFTQNERWSRQTVSSWSATISITSSQSGLRVEMTSKINPAVVEGHDTSAAYFPFDVEAIHRETLPDKLTTLHEILPALKDALEGSWAYASLGTQKVGFVHPVFTRRGDFVLELYPHEEAAGIVVRAGTPLRAPLRAPPVVEVDYIDAPAQPQYIASQTQSQYLTSQTQSQGRTFVHEMTSVRAETASPAAVTRVTVNSVATPPVTAELSYVDDLIFAPKVYSAPVVPAKASATPTPPQAYRARSFYTNGDYRTSS